MLAKILSSHCSTLAMPAWETLTPRRWPAHDMLRHSSFPQSKVCLVSLFAHAVQLARVVYHVVKVSSRQNTVLMVLVILSNIKVNATIALVSISICHYLLHEFLLLNDVSCGARLYRWRQNVKRMHSIVVSIGIKLSYFHWLELFQSCFLFYLVVAFIGIVF